MADTMKTVIQIRDFLRTSEEAQRLRDAIRTNEEHMRRLYPYVSNKELVGYEQLHAQMNECSSKYHQARSELDTLLKEQFPQFAADPRHKTIYEGILDDTLNYEVLSNVLRQVEKFRKGEITYAQGFNQGLDFITRKSNLPSDFFNRMPEKE